MTGPSTVAVVNAGSGSLGLSVVRVDSPTVERQDIDAPPDSEEARQALEEFLGRHRDVGAVGHRIVHGGPELDRHCRVDRAVLHALEGAADLAPLHVPPALAALRAARGALPDTPHIACLDTAFHRSLPTAARTYPVPGRWRRSLGVRRYGFHGLSYAWATNRTAALLGRSADELSVVLTHLGGGASVCAVDGGVSVWCSMGFTPLEGLPMMTRSGSVDPGLLLWLQQSAGLTVDEVADGLQHDSGLLGLSDGFSGDTRVLVDAEAHGDRRAALALDVYVLRVRQEIAAAAASLGRLDGLVFTGEIGADQPEIRERVAAGLTVLGVRGGLNPAIDTDRVVSGPDATVPVLTVLTQEDRQIAEEVGRVLSGT